MNFSCIFGCKYGKIFVADVYYITGVAAEGIATSIMEGDDDSDEDKNENKKLSAEDKQKLAENLNLAIESYNTSKKILKQTIKLQLKKK